MINAGRKFSPDRIFDYWDINRATAASWAMQFGSFTAVQATGGNQPTVTTSQNGNRGLSFNGSTSVMNIADITLSNNCFVQIVFQNATQTSNVATLHRAFFCAQANPYVTNSNGFGFGLKRSGAAGIYVIVPNTGAVSAIDYNLAADDEFYVLSLHMRSGTANVFLNNTNLGSLACDKTAGFSAGYRIGAETAIANRYYTGILADIIAHNGVVSAQHVIDCRQFAYDKFNITP